MPELAPSVIPVGVVAIGRNEGERLRACLESVAGRVQHMVYVDSGSSDDSLEMARHLGVVTVELDMSRPFTAARARNEGYRRLMEVAPTLAYVQFVDGDCQVADGWLDTAWRFLESRSDVAVVCGRRRERFPERSVFNLLCDMEWDTPVGQTRSCGGDAMMRTEVLERVGGYRDDLIAGEEPELCVRIRSSGGKVWRLAQEMTLHDAAIYRIGQWWNRTKRSGYAFAEGAFLHGESPERHGVRQSRSALIWGLFIPLLATILLFCLGWRALLLWLLYPAQIIRLTLGGTRSVRENCLQAWFLVTGKFPEAAGQLKFWHNRISGKRAHLIEYK